MALTGMEEANQTLEVLYTNADSLEFTAGQERWIIVSTSTTIPNNYKYIGVSYIDCDQSNFVLKGFLFDPSGTKGIRMKNTNATSFTFAAGHANMKVMFLKL